MHRVLSLCLLFGLVPLAALAQEVGTPVADPGVVVPWGTWVVSGIDALVPVALFALTTVSTYVIGAYVPRWMQAIAGTSAQARVNSVLEKAVMSAAAQVKGAALNKRLTVPLTNEVLRRASQYAIDQAPKLMAEATHGSGENLIKMLLARMEQWGMPAPNYQLPAAAKTPAKKAETTMADAVAKHLGG